MHANEPLTKLKQFEEDFKTLNQLLCLVRDLRQQRNQLDTKVMNVENDIAKLRASLTKNFNILMRD